LRGLQSALDITTLVRTTTTQQHNVREPSFPRKYPLFIGVPIEGEKDLRKHASTTNTACLAPYSGMFPSDLKVKLVLGMCFAVPHDLRRFGKLLQVLLGRSERRLSLDWGSDGYASSIKKALLRGQQEVGTQVAC
jgi:hypothetical protein